MSADPEIAAREAARRRRWIIIGVVIGLLGIAIAVGMTTLWLLYFASEAPPPPTIDKALQELLPSVAPGVGE
jgi:hypothetical protein